MSGTANIASPAITHQNRQREDIPDALYKRATTESYHVSRDVSLQEGIVDLCRDTTEYVGRQLPPPANFSQDFSGGFWNEPTIFAENASISNQPTYQYAPRSSKELLAQHPYPPLTIHTARLLPSSMWLYHNRDRSDPIQAFARDDGSSNWATTGDEHFESEMRRLFGLNLQEPPMGTPVLPLQEQQYPAMTKYAPQPSPPPHVQLVQATLYVPYTEEYQNRRNPSDVAVQHPLAVAQKQPYHNSVNHSHAIIQQVPAVSYHAAPLPPVVDDVLNTVGNGQWLQVLTWKTPALRNEDISNGQRLSALQYTATVYRDPEQKRIIRIPGIPADFIFNFEQEPWTFQPDDIWSLRHLELGLRHWEHANFVELGLFLKHSEPSSTRFDSAWKVLRQRTAILREKEQAFCQKFLGVPEHETHEERQRRTERWTKLTTEQALAAYLDPGTQQFVHVGLEGHKRALGNDDEMYVQHFPKKMRMNEGLGGSSVSGDEAEHYFQQMETPQRKDPESVQYPSQQEEEIPYWKRNYWYPGDKTQLPDHPFPSPYDYTIQIDTGRWRCFHKDVDCSNGVCKYTTHKCCKTGYDESGMKRAIKKATEKYYKDVEGMISEGKLDKQHKWWEKHYLKPNTTKPKARSLRLRRVDKVAPTPKILH